MRNTLQPAWCKPRIAGVSGLGDTTQGGLKFADNAVIAPQFKAGTPGRYAIDVVVVGVPIAADKSPYIDVASWNDSIASAGYSNVTVESVDFVPTGAAANPRSTGGSLDVFGWGTDVADYTYRLTISVAPTDSEAAGLGVITTAGWIAIGAVVVAVNLLIFKLTGTDVLVSTVKWLGSFIGTTAGALATGALPAILPILGVAALALFVFVKMGGRGSYKDFSIGGRS